MKETEEGMDRREFLRHAGRWLVVFTLGGGLTALVSRPGEKAAATGQRCINQGVCRHCPVFDNCGLPQALSARRARENAERAL